jgi:hypothetical protein
MMGETLASWTEFLRPVGEHAGRLARSLVAEDLALLRVFRVLVDAGDLERLLVRPRREAM